MERKKCPPGFRRQGPKCVPVRPTAVPMNRRFFGAPAGGPTSSPWSTGPAAKKATCVQALVSACFNICAPVLCGFISDPPGSVIPGNGSAVFGTVGVGGTLYKGGLIFAADATVQAKFREFTTAPANKLYAVVAFDAGGIGVVGAVLLGSGAAQVTVNGTLFVGTWTPTPGATHTVHAYSQNGVGFLFIDGVQIPLVPGGPSPITFMPNTFGFSAFNTDMDSTAEFFSAFGANGVFPPTTVFCCG
jgi:hypothetical protein